MENLLIKIMFLAAITQLGLTLHDFVDCHDRACMGRIEAKSRKVLDVGWKPMSVFPEEAKRFR
jgi:hypothetical protein